MEPVTLTETVLGRPLTLRAEPVGEDLLLLVTGGDSPHIGSLTAAAPGIGPESFVFPGHRDEAVGELFAARLAPLFPGRVAVVCGIHYDGITREGIEAVLSAGERLALRLLPLLS